MVRSGAIDRATEACARVELNRIPEAVRRRASLVIADTVGVVMAGAREEEIKRWTDMLTAEGIVTRAQAGDESRQGSASTVIADRVAVAPAEYAALVNGSAASFLELDEGIRPTGHPGVQVVVAALAVAERERASGSALLQAVIGGYELAARLFRSFRFSEGVHPHGNFGVAGAALACALLTGVDPVTAVRIACATPLATHWEACFEGATARNLWMGLAAAAGVRACTLAKAGFQGSSRSMELLFGQLLGELEKPTDLVRPIAYDELAIQTNYFKWHSACALSHSAIDAVLDLDLQSSEVERVVVEAAPIAMKLARMPMPNDLSSRFSLPYSVAAALQNGKAGPDEVVYTSSIAELASRIEVRPLDLDESTWPAFLTARVSVEAEGEVRVSERTNPEYYGEYDAVEPALREKFLRLIASPGFARSWWHRLVAIDQVLDCSTLLKR